MEKNEGKRVYKLVLTGGPCGGKTTGQSRLCTFFENLGWKVFRVPETASVLLSGGIKFTDLSEEEGRHLSRLGSPHNAEGHSCKHCMPVACSGSEAEAFKFQENLLKTMIQIENTFFELGKTCKRNCLIICDRGAMDASAFISKEKWDKLMRENSWNDIDLRDNRYNQIIHMVSAANGAEEFYTTEDHSCRSEGVELAKELDYNAAAAWVGHPYFDVIDNCTDFEGKIRRMIGSVCQKMAIDTGDRLLMNSRKLKFLVKGPLPPKSMFPRFGDFEVVHTYLQSNSPNQVRLRKRGQKGYFSYIHTVRRQRQPGGQVIEVKTQITHRDYLNLLAQKDKSHFTIFKKRRCFLVNNQYFQLDIYEEPSHPRCKGLMLLETYSALDEKSLRKCLPDFLTIEKEVTGNPDYSMYNLSLREDWKNSKKYWRSMPDTNDSGMPVKTNGHNGIIKMNGHSETNGSHMSINGTHGLTNSKTVAGMS